MKPFFLATQKEIAMLFALRCLFAMFLLASPWTVGSLTAGEKVAAEPTVSGVTSSSQSEFQITYSWKIEAPSQIDYRVFVHFTDDVGEIRFQNDHDAQPLPSKWRAGILKQGPNSVKVPAGVVGTVEIRMGLFDTNGDKHRAILLGKSDDEHRVIVGTLKIGDGRVVFIPPKKKN